ESAVLRGPYQELENLLRRFRVRSGVSHVERLRLIQQKDLHVLGAVGVQVQVDARMTRCGAVQDRAHQVRVELVQPPHPSQRQAPQRGQLRGLAVGGEQAQIAPQLG